MSDSKHVTVPDSQGQEHEYVVMALREENGVPYAILSPEEAGTDPNAYVACGYEQIGDERRYYRLPDDISQQLVAQDRAEHEIV